MLPPSTWSHTFPSLSFLCKRKRGGTEALPAFSLLSLGYSPVLGTHQCTRSAPVLTGWLPGMCDSEVQGEKATAERWDLLRSRGRDHKVLLLIGDFFFFFSALPLITLPLRGCIIKNSRCFTKEFFWPSAFLPQKSPLKMTARSVFSEQQQHLSKTRSRPLIRANFLVYFSFSVQIASSH